MELAPNGELPNPDLPKFELPKPGLEVGAAEPLPAVGTVAPKGFDVPDDEKGDAPNGFVAEVDPNP